MGNGADNGAAAGEDGPTAIVLGSCADRPGLVASIADFVFRHGGNIVHADQHVDQQTAMFFIRVEFALDGFALARPDILPALRGSLERFAIDLQIRFSDEGPRLAVLVSNQPHCLYDLLVRGQLGELRATIPLVVSNHPDHAELVAGFGARYHHLPVDPADPAAQEAAVLELLERYSIELVVLARYMRVLSPEFVARYRNRIINIHHSFLPAFTGARPYHRAHARGVKLIGATAHYASEEVDEGPIIDQDVARVSHRDTVEDLVRRGRDIEKVVLGRAVRAHLESRLIVAGNKTVVFE